MLFWMVQTASEGLRKIDVPILVIVTVGRTPIIVYETGVMEENCCLRMLFPQSAHVLCSMGTETRCSSFSWPLTACPITLAQRDLLYRS